MKKAAKEDEFVRKTMNEGKLVDSETVVNLLANEMDQSDK